MRGNWLYNELGQNWIGNTLEWVCGASGVGLGEMQMQNGGDLDLANFRASGAAFATALATALATGPRPVCLIFLVDLNPMHRT